MSYFEKEKVNIDGFKASLDQMPGIKLSADIFGSVCCKEDAGGIGQTLET